MNDKFNSKIDNNYFYSLLAKQTFSDGNEEDKIKYLNLYNEILLSMKLDKTFNNCPTVHNLKPEILEDLEKKINKL